MQPKAISYVNYKDGNQTIEDTKQRLFHIAPDFPQAIMRDAVTITDLQAELRTLRGEFAEQAKENAKLRGLLGEYIKNFDDENIENDDLKQWLDDKWIPAVRSALEA